jgi:hypothetical protein
MDNQIEEAFKAKRRHYLDAENQLCNPWNDYNINFMLPHADTYANDPTLFKQYATGLNAFYADITKRHPYVIARSIHDTLDRLILRLGYKAIMHARTGLHYADAVLVEYNGSIVIIELL